MKIRVIIFILLMLGISISLPGCAHRKPWSKTDKVLFTAVVAAQVTDYVHTKNFLDDGDYIMDACAWKCGTRYPSDGRLVGGIMITIACIIGGILILARLVEWLLDRRDRERIERDNIAY